MSMHNEPMFKRIFMAIKARTGHYTPEDHDDAASGHLRQSEMVGDDMWKGFEHVCHAEAHEMLAKNKRNGLKEMYKFKTNILKEENKYNYTTETILHESTKNKIHFVSPWKDELEDLDYTKTIAVTHKIENDGRKNIKKSSGSQVRKQVRARKAKEDSESVSRMLQSLFPNTRGR